MGNRIFLTVAAALSLLTLWAAGCKQPPDPCIRSLRERDAQLAQKADSLILLRENMMLEPYRAALGKLQIEEKQIFREVENCDFGKDLQAYNYWYRGRLKFPGKIEQELRRLERDSVK